VGRVEVRFGWRRWVSGLWGCARVGAGLYF